MVNFISSIGSNLSVVLGELTRLGTYLDSYPVIYFVLLICIVLDVCMILRYLINL